MKKGLFFLLSLSVLCISCKRNVTHGTGESGSDTRNVSGFSAIEISAPVHAMIKVDSNAQAAVELEGYKNLLSLIKTEVRGNTLRIYMDDLAHYNTDKDIVAHITVPSLTSLEISGAGEADIAGKVSVTDFKLDITGSGDVMIENISSNNFSADLSGAGNLEIKNGSTDKAIFDVTGAGAVSSYPFVAKHVVATVTGAGDIEVNATEHLDANITGVGNISYKGHPVIAQDITGAGDLEDAN